MPRLSLSFASHYEAPLTNINKHMPTCSGTLTLVPSVNDPLSIKRFTSCTKACGVRRNYSFHVSSSSYTILCMNSAPLSSPLSQRSLGNLAMLGGSDIRPSKLSINITKRRFSLLSILHFNNAHAELKSPTCSQHNGQCHIHSTSN